ncbi:MAG: cobalt-zinc-cadmium efflux system protein [Chloroflexota bacterium]|jgi:cobalt-zinc-cadmium efflux system protein|nr:cobalt-zinc-cadmium efflux system protein [Chloroflexota bacterium]
MDQVRDRSTTLKVALGLTCVVLLIELLGGLAAHSLALLSDAGHVLTDVFALGLAWFAVAQAKRPADQRRSYGYHRVSILAALVNAVTLIVIVIVIAVEAVRRLANPEPVQGGLVIVAALVGIAINAFVVFGLRGDTHNLNMRAALLHVTGDIGASIGVAISGAVILLTGWLAIDPLLSIAIAVLIAFGAWRIVRETVNLLMEGTPRDINLGAVTSEITRTALISSMHDLHVWALSSDEMALSVHVVIDDCPLGEAEHVVRDLERRLCDRFAIGHTTIQVESCHPCGEINHGAGQHNHPHAHVVVVSSAERPPAAGSAAPLR